MFLPAYLQGSLGVLVPIQIANNYAKANSRFYFDDDKIIAFKEGKYVICKQWDIKNITRFVKAAKRVGYEIEELNY